MILLTILGDENTMEVPKKEGMVMAEELNPTLPPLEQSNRRRLPEEKWQIFLEAARGDLSVSEVLRRHGLTFWELRRIRDKVKAGALWALQRGRSHSKAKSVSQEEYEALKREKERLEKALVEQSIELALLKKRVNLE